MNEGSTIIKVDELKFYKGRGDYWTIFPKEPYRGLVGCFGAGGLSDWNLFVIVDYDTNTKSIGAIFPRMHMNENNQVEIGMDKTTENSETILRQYITYEKVVSDYPKSFTKVAPDYQYRIYAFEKPTDGIFLQHIPKKLVNNLDIPLIRCTIDDL